MTSYELQLSPLLHNTYIEIVFVQRYITCSSDQIQVGSAEKKFIAAVFYDDFINVPPIQLYLQQKKGKTC